MNPPKDKIYREARKVQVKKLEAEINKLKKELASEREFTDLVASELSLMKYGHEWDVTIRMLARAQQKRRKLRRVK